MELQILKIFLKNSTDICYFLREREKKIDKVSFELGYRSRRNWKKLDGNMDATLVLRCLSEPESEADLRSVKISEIAQKLTEIATFFQ